jgi:adenylate kinase
MKAFWHQVGLREGLVDKIMSKASGKKTLYSFFGPPGSGKGTVAQRCVRELGFKVLSTGNLCRKHVALNTEFGKALQAMKEGHLVPDDLITNAVCDWIEENKGSDAPIILDGYPRTAGQAESFYKILAHKLSDYTFKVILFEISNEEVIKRLLRRVVCSNRDCQIVYSLNHDDVNDVCRECQSKLHQRADDDIKVIKERLALYPRHKEELFNYFQEMRQPIGVLNVENISIDEVFVAFKALL